VQQTLFACAVRLSVILAMGVFVAWLTEAYITWPHPERSAWLVRQFTVGFDFNGGFLSRVPYAAWLPLTLLLPLYADWKRGKPEAPGLRRSVHVVATIFAPAAIVVRSAGYDSKSASRLRRCSQFPSRGSAIAPLHYGAGNIRALPEAQFRVMVSCRLRIVRATLVQAARSSEDICATAVGLDSPTESRAVAALGSLA